jgi:hypothetical protein
MPDALPDAGIARDFLPDLIFPILYKSRGIGFSPLFR